MEPSKSALSWGQTVELLRRLREWNQEELAERADLSLSTLSSYETRKREPTDEGRVAVERALGVAGWMEEAQAHLGYLRRAMERPFDLGEALEKEAAERAAQVEILLRAGVARLLGPENSRNDARNSPHGPKGSDHDPKDVSHSPENSAKGRRNSSRGPKNSPRGPRNSAHGPKNSRQGP